MDPNRWKYMVCKEVDKMTSEELRHSVEQIFNDAITLQLYLIIKTEDDVEIKLADIDNGDTLNDLKRLFVNKVFLIFQIEPSCS